MIAKVARATAFDWPGFTEADDIQQLIYMRLLESDSTVEKLVDMNDSQRYGALKMIANQIASQERTDYDHFRGNFYYSTREVRSFLDRGALIGYSEDWEEESGVQDEILYGFEVGFVDVRASFDTLRAKNSHYAKAIWSRYVLGVSSEGSTERSVLQRSVDKLTEIMNQQRRTGMVEHDGPGSRDVISNDTAHYLTKANEDGFDWPDGGTYNNG